MQGMGSAARTRLVRAWECATEGADPEEPNVMTAAMLRASCRLLDISDADASALVTQLLLGGARGGETSRSASPSSSPSSSTGSSGSGGRAEEGETKTAASPGAEGWIDFPQWVELVKPTMTMTMAMEADTTTMATSTTTTTFTTIQGGDNRNPNKTPAAAAGV